MPEEARNVRSLGLTHLDVRSASVTLRRGLREAVSVAGDDEAESIDWKPEAVDGMLVGVVLDHRVDGRAEPHARPLRVDGDSLSVAIPPADVEALGTSADDADGLDVELFAGDGLIALAPVQEREIVVDLED